jgi:hypothetical protein
MATGSATFDVADVGLYVDPLNIGAAPSWELPAWDADLRACQRYYERQELYEQGIITSYSFHVPKRIVPTMTTTGATVTPSLSGFVQAAGSSSIRTISANARF